nr:ABC transporter ATP-binding protein [Streptomyces sp. TLI_235]
MPVLLLPGAANQYLRNRQAHLFTAMWRKGVDHALHSDVWQEALTEVGPSMEVRVFGFGEWMVERIQNHLRAMFDPIWAVFHRMLFNEWSQFLLVGVPLGIVYLAVAEDAARGRASTAVLTAVLTASWALVQSLGYSDDVRNIRAATESLLAYERLREILTPQAGTVDALPAPRVERRDGPPSVVFEDVSFTYPGTERTVLHGLDLEIRPGELLAVVGLNGAGKSTVIKLLSGLYRPTGGRITADGRDLADLGAAAWREHVSVVFQDFVKYRLSAADNVALGHATVPVDHAALDAAAKDSGFDAVLERLPDGWQTPLAHRRRRPLRRPVAAGGPRPRAVRRAHRRRTARAGRADRAPGRADRVRGVQPARRTPRQGERGADLAPAVHRPAGGPDRAPRRRPDHRIRHPRRTDGPRRQVRRALRHPGRAVPARLRRPRGRKRTPVTVDRPEYRPSARDYLRLARELLTLSYRRAPGLTVAALATQALTVATVAATALTLRAAINGAIDGAAGTAVTGALGAAVAYAVTGVLADLSGNVMALLVDKVSVLDLNEFISRDLALLDGLEHVERTDFLDRVTIVRGAPWGIINGLWSAVSAFFGVVQLGVSLLLGTVSPWLLLLLLFAAAPIWFDRQGQRRISRAETETAEAFRLQKHLFDTATEAGPAKEIRVAGAGAELARRQAAAWDEVALGRFRAQLVSAAWRVSGWTLFTAGFVAGLAVVIQRTARGDGSPGDVVLAITVASTLRGSVQAAVGRTTDTVAAQRLVEPFLWLRGYAADRRADSSEGIAPPDRLTAGITFEQVGYRYPGTDRYALEDVSFSIPAGTVVAVVGEYGSGKTTLVKLLNRFYRPDHRRRHRPRPLRQRRLARPDQRRLPGLRPLPHRLR